MAEIPGKRRGRPRKAVADAEISGTGGATPAVCDGDGEASGRDAAAKAGPSDWQSLHGLLSGLECLVAPKLVCLAWVDFDAHPVWHGSRCGVPIERGEWKVLLNDGTYIYP